MLMAINLRSASDSETPPQKDSLATLSTIMTYSILLLMGFILSNELTLSANADLLIDATESHAWTLGQVGEANRTELCVMCSLTRIRRSSRFFLS